MTVVYSLLIPNFHPTPLNKLLSVHWAKAARMKRNDRDIIWSCFIGSKIPRASTKRRITLILTLKPFQRATDPDSHHKSTGDALVKCGALKNDSHVWVEWMPTQFKRGTAKAWGTQILIEDI